MSHLTDVTMVINPDERQRFEDLIERHQGFRPNPAEPHPNCTGSYVYALGLDYAKVKLLEALAEGPWKRGTVLYVHDDAWERPLIKVFGDVPPGGWAAKPEIAL